MFRLLLPKNTKTLVFLKNFTEFDPQSIENKIGLKIRGIILDVDGTIAYEYGDILPQNLAHIQKLLKHGIRIVLYSNLKETGRYNVLNKSIKILTNLPAKPDKKGFLIALETLGVNKSNVVMIGDNYVTDGGATSIGIPFVHVQPIYRNWTEKMKLTSLLKAFFYFIAKLYKSISPTPLFQHEQGE